MAAFMEGKQEPILTGPPGFNTAANAAKLYTISVEALRFELVNFQNPPTRPYGVGSVIRD